MDGAIAMNHVVESDKKKRQFKLKIMELEHEMRMEKDPARAKMIEEHIEKLKKLDEENQKRNLEIAKANVMLMTANTKFRVGYHIINNL
uniref:RH61042p n=1 Tax=Drosophila melanogaster TaxID=7227 RepID=Q8IGC1_DROME|nr:RH61042p [Drosophila melanogaster]